MKEEVGAVSMNTQCHACQGMGHVRKGLPHSGRQCEGEAQWNREGQGSDDVWDQRLEGWRQGHERGKGRPQEVSPSPPARTPQEGLPGLPEGLGRQRGRFRLRRGSAGRAFRRTKIRSRRLRPRGQRSGVSEFGGSMSSSPQGSQVWRPRHHRQVCFCCAVARFGGSLLRDVGGDPRSKRRFARQTAPRESEG